MSRARTAELVGKHLLNDLKLRTKQGSETKHMLVHILSVSEILNVTELIELVVSDGLNRHYLLYLRKVLGRCRHNSNTRAGVRDLGGRRKVEHSVIVTRLTASLEDIKKNVSALLVELVNSVSVVPEDTEVGSCGLHRSQTADRLVGIGIAVGVGVLGVTPDTLDGRVGSDKTLNGIHIGTCLCHLNGNKLEAQGLCNGKVTVVTGARTKEGKLLLFSPRSLTAHNAVKERSRDGVVHKIEGCVTANYYIFSGDTQKVCEKLLRFGNTVKNTVVTAVKTRLAEAILILGKSCEHIGHNVKLCASGLTS